MEKADFLVVGGGPAGAAAAIEAVRQRAGKVVLLEKQPLPRMKACAGGLSLRAEDVLKSLHLWEKLKPEIQSVTSARIVTPAGREFLLAGDQTASVINRQIFDQFLLNQAREEGVRIRSELNVTGLEATGSGSVLVHGVSRRRTGGSTGTGRCGYEARHVVVAAGAGTKLRRDNRPSDVVTSCTSWFRGVEFRPDRLEMIFDPALSPHYGWLFPESESSCNIGLCVFKKKIRGLSVFDLYAEFLDRHFAGRMSRAVELGTPRVHPIIPAPRVDHLSLPGTLLAGDAGRYINAFTGEGISFALQSGRMAAQAFTLADEHGWDFDTLSARYRRSLRREMGRSLLAGNMLCRTAPALLNLAGKTMGVPLVRRGVTRMLSKV